MAEVKINGPDYRDVEPDAAVKDFHKRIEHYERTYQAIDPELDEYVFFFEDDVRTCFMIRS